MYLEHYLDSKRPPRSLGPPPWPGRTRHAPPPPRALGSACGPRGTWGRRDGLEAAGAAEARAGREGPRGRGTGGAARGPAVTAAPIPGASRRGGGRRALGGASAARLHPPRLSSAHFRHRPRSLLPRTRLPWLGPAPHSLGPANFVVGPALSALAPPSLSRPRPSESRPAHSRTRPHRGDPLRWSSLSPLGLWAGFGGPRA